MPDPQKGSYWNYLEHEEIADSYGDREYEEQLNRRDAGKKKARTLMGKSAEDMNERACCLWCGTWFRVSHGNRTICEGCRKGGVQKAKLSDCEEDDVERYRP